MSIPLQWFATAERETVVARLSCDQVPDTSARVKQRTENVLLPAHSGCRRVPCHGAQSRKTRMCQSVKPKRKGLRSRVAVEARHKPLAFMQGFMTYLLCSLALLSFLVTSAAKGKPASNNPYTDLCLEEVPPDT